MKMKRIFEATVKTIPGRTEVVLLPAAGDYPTVGDAMQALGNPYLCTYHMFLKGKDMGCMANGGMLKVAGTVLEDKATVYFIRKDMLEK